MCGFVLRIKSVRGSVAATALGRRYCQVKLHYAHIATAIGLYDLVTAGKVPRMDGESLLPLCSCGLLPLQMPTSALHTTVQTTYHHSGIFTSRYSQLSITNPRAFCPIEHRTSSTHFHSHLQDGTMSSHLRARLLSRIPPRLTRRRRFRQPQVFSRTKLPSEILLMIFDCLPLEGKVSLALCDRSFYEFGKRHHVFGELRIDRKARQKFLEIYRLDHINPYYVACGDCRTPHKVIHYARDYTRNSRKNKHRHCWKYEGLDNSALYFHPKFGFGDVQVAARLHRRGELRALEKYIHGLWAQGKGTRSISEEPISEEGDKGRSSAHIWDFKVAVANNNCVYVRKQEWLPFSSTTSVAIPAEKEAWTVCCHVNTVKAIMRHEDEFKLAETALGYHKAQGEFSSLLNKSTGTILKPVPATPKAFLHSDMSDNWAHFSLHQCRICPTEYRIDFGVVSKSLFAIVLTKWMCLGVASHRRSSSSSLWVKHLDTGAQPYSFEHGSVFEKYEGYADQRLYRPV